LTTTLEGRVALVTGGGRGIGRGIALCLARGGADVAINYRANEAAARATQQEVEGLGRRANCYQCDVSESYEAVQAMVDQVALDFGRLDILVNNAGMDLPQRRPVGEADMPELHAIVAANFYSAYSCTTAAIPHLRRQPRGDIVFISSTLAGDCLPGRAPYSAAKAAVEALAMTVAREERASGIRSNVIRSGLVETDMGQRVAQRRGVEMKDLAELAPFGRLGQPEDIGSVVAFLCSQGGEYMTGATLLVSGGVADWLP
jgi:NAD(P)-dependent dehydrogenase (short-subunit alcohol dehydrogenase family)